MTDPFLDATKVKTEADAMKNAIAAALQRNKTYRDGLSDIGKQSFRSELAKLIRAESQPYAQPVGDLQHCEAIRRISDRLPQTCGQFLVNGRMRYGTSQKALNLYLKFLWRMGKITEPPHCPVDSIVLANGGIDAAWTKSDSEKEYVHWISILRRNAKPLSLAEWEYRVWLQGAVK